MPWTNPENAWVDGQIFGASDANIVADNLLYLFNPPTDEVILNEVADFTTTSTSYVDVDATLELNLTTSGGDILVGFTGSVINNSNGSTLVDIEVDGARVGGDDGFVRVHNASTTAVPVSFVRLLTGKAADTYTIKLKWRVSLGTATLYAGAGTSNADIHPQFWAREIS